MKDPAPELHQGRIREADEALQHVRYAAGLQAIRVAGCVQGKAARRLLYRVEALERCSHSVKGAAALQRVARAGGVQGMAARGVL